MTRILFNLSFIISLAAFVLTAWLLWPNGLAAAISYAFVASFVAFIMCLVGVFFLGMAIGRGASNDKG